jgi:hypothetical protein
MCVQVQQCICKILTHIDIRKKERTKMLTLRLFDSLTKITKPTMSDKELAVWARTEYKKDAEYAYFHMKQYGVAPKLGVAR